LQGKWHGDVVIKKLNVDSPSLEQMLAFRREVSILRRTRHENVVLFMGACTEGSNLCIVTKYCEGPTLTECISLLHSDMRVYEAVEMMRQVAQGMEYLHAKSIIHRNLKAKNVFLESSGKLSIGDFGLATMMQQILGMDSAGIGRSDSIRHVAPEIMSADQGQPTKQSDVYAFGALAFEVISGRVPFAEVPASGLRAWILAGNMPDTRLIFAGVPEEVSAHVIRCFTRSPRERPGFKETVNVLDAYPRASLLRFLQLHLSGVAESRRDAPVRRAQTLLM
jgi:serine/threonine protein kinase